MPDSPAAMKPASLPASVLLLAASRLGIAQDVFAPGVLSMEYLFAAAQILVHWPCIGDPSALGFPDKTFFEQAAGLVVCARLFGPLASGAGGVLLAQKSADGDSETYAAPPSSSPAVWLAEAQEAVQLLSCVRASLAASASSFNFIHAGNSRFRRLGASNLLGASNVFGAPGGFLGGLLDYSEYPLAFPILGLDAEVTYIDPAFGL